jgi:hypothetical protein
MTSVGDCPHILKQVASWSATASLTGFQAYFILNTKLYSDRGSARGRLLGLESVSAFQKALDSSSTRVNSHLIRESRVGRESSFQAGLELGPVFFKYEG